MKMDNSDFKRKAMETTGLFGKLQQALSKVPGVNNLNKVKDSLSGINSAAQRVDLSSIASNVDTISGRFSNLGVVATTALVNIANRAVNTGAQVLKSLTVAPVMDGFREYELKMGSIGTMLSNTEHAGSTLEDVKKTLGELNEYADQTIYNFGQMTQNIGRFTAAGVSLEDSTTAIKGLGNLAAVSGSDVNQLNTAMYQMSQALAAGKLNLMDWNSMVNAGMGGKKTQDALLATAKAMGKNVDMSDGFRNSIEQGWLTSEVLLETLKKFGSDESMTKAATRVKTFTGMMDALREGIGSGWATTWELIIGDFEEASKRWTALSEVLGGFFKLQSDARNKLVKKFADAGIFEGLFKVITNAGMGVLKIVTAIQKGIGKAFGGGNSGLLKAMGKGLNKFAEALIPGKKTLEVITVIFQALFTPIALVVKGLLLLGKVFIAILKVPLKLIGLVLEGIFKLVGFIADLGTSMFEAATDSKFLGKVMDGIGNIFKGLNNWIDDVVGGLSIFRSAIVEAFNILVRGDFTGKGPWAEDSKIVDKLFRIREAVQTFVSGVVEAWNILVKGDFTGKGPWEEDSKIVDKLFRIREAVQDVVGGIMQAWYILATGDYRNIGPWEEDSKIVDKLFDMREAVFDFANGVIEAWNILAYGDFTGVGPWEEDSKVVDALFDMREAVLDFANGVIEAWNILAKGNFTGVGPWEEDSKIVDALFRMREAVIKFADTVSETWTILTSGKASDNGPWSEDSPIVKGLVKMREGFQNLGDAILDLKFSALLTPIILGFGLLFDFMKTLDPSKILVPVANGFARITGAIADMNFTLQPVVDFFGMLFEDIGKGVKWVVDGFKKLGAAIKEHLPSGNDLMAGGFIAAIVTIVGFATKLAWDWHQIFKGWGEIGTGVSEVLEGTGNALNAFTWQVRANMLVAIAIGVGILAASFWVMSKLNSTQIANGLYAIIGSLTALIGAMMIMTKYDITGTGMKAVIQIIALATAFAILSVALRNISDLGWEEITKGIVGMVAVMGTFAGAVTLMSKYGGAKLAGTATQFLAIAGTVYLLVLVIEKIASVDTGKLIKGTTGLAVVIGILVGSLTLMGKYGGGKIAASALQFLALAGSILIIVEAIRQISDIDPGPLTVGLVTIGLILGAIAAFAVITSNKGLLTSGIGIALLAVALNLLLIPILALGSMSLETLAKGLGAMAIALIAIGAASMLMTGMVAAGAGLILLAVGMNMLMIPIAAFAAMPLKALAVGIGALAIGILAIGGAAALLGLAGPALLIGAAGIGLLGIALLAAGAGISLFSTALVTLAAMTGTAVITIVSFLGTLIVGLASLIPKAVEFVWMLIQHMATAFRDNAPTLATTMADALLGILDVIATYIPKFVDAGTKIITNFLDSMAENLPKIVMSATNLMVAFVEGLAAAVQTNGPKFKNAIMTLMAEVLVIVVETGVAVIQALFGWIPGVTEATNEIGSTAEKTIRDAFGAKEAGQDKGKDFASGLSGKSGDAKSAGTKVGDNAERGADSANLKTIGSGHGQDFASGISSKISAAKTSGQSIANGGKSGASGISLSTTGKNFGQGFASGISGAYNSVVTAAKSLARRAKNAIADWLGIASPSRVMRVDGGWFGQGFALGIADKAKTVGEKAKGLAMTAKDSLNRFLDGFQLPEEDSELRFKAVIDYDSFDARRFGRVAPIAVQPDVSTTRGLVGATKSNFRQNGYKVPEGNVDKSTTNNNKYDIHVNANGTMSKSAVRKLAEDIQTEIKNLNDRGRISRGEEVAF